MQERIPQSIAKRIVFKAFLAADHVTAAGAALTIPVQISKNGGAFANLATPANATHMDPHDSGWYYIQLAIADTDTLGPLVVRGTEGTIDPVELICEVVAPTNAGFTALPAVAAGAASGLPLKDANNFLNVANIPAYAAGATSGLAIVGSSMVVPNTQKVDVDTIKTSSPAAANVASVYNSIDYAPNHYVWIGDSGTSSYETLACYLLNGVTPASLPVAGDTLLVDDATVGFVASPLNGILEDGVTATFNGTSINGGTVGGEATFNDSSYNTLDGTVGERATFNDGSYNPGTVGEGATFNDGSYNPGTVGEGATFNDGSYNTLNGTVGKGATLNTTTAHLGTFSGSVLMLRACNISGATIAGPINYAYDTQAATAGTVDARLAAYDSNGGVAKQASVGAIATILAGITSLANWLRGLYNKRTMDSTAQTEIRDTTGTFDPTTDSAEAIRDKLPANLEDLAIVDTVGTVAVPDTQKVDVNTIKTKAVAASNTVTFANGTVAISGADGDTLETLSDQIDEISVELSPEDLQAIIDGLIEGGVTDWTVEQRAAILAAIAAIQAKTNTIGSGRITYASTVGEASLATIWAGDDYRAADGTQFSITVEDYAGPSLATATAVLRIMDSVQYLSAVDGVSVKADLEVPATITINGTTITLAADLTAAQTAALATSPPQLAHNYVYEFVCTLANGHIGYRTHGRMTVKKAIAAGT